MGLRWASILLVAMCLTTKTHGLPEESLQSLEPAGAEKSFPLKNETLLREFYDHAEYKALSSNVEQITDIHSTTELPEPLPTPVAVTLKKSNAEEVDTEKKLSVPKKGVAFKKSSVVPKKGVHFTPSVVAKKGADPESSTPSVSPRKGVELPQMSRVLSPGSPGHDLLSMSSESMNNTSFSTLFSDNKDSNDTPRRINETEKEAQKEVDAKADLNNIPTPQLVKNKGQANNSMRSGSGNTSQLLIDSHVTLVAVVPYKSESVSSIVHHKPTTADDPGAASSQVSYAPLFMVVALVALVVVVVAVAYHKLKDIWVRRHYDYVDFLIDGMYE